jgi:hypothetical protein
MKRFLVLVCVVTVCLLSISFVSDTYAAKPLRYEDGPNPPKPTRVPKGPPDSDFDNVKVIKGTTGDDTQIEFGTTGKDKIIEYGGKGNNTQFVSGAGEGDKTIIQVGGKGTNNMMIDGSSGKNHIEQYGGTGNNSMRVTGGVSDDVIIMYGGPNNDTLTINKNLQNLVLQDIEDNVLFTTGTVGTTITVSNIQHVTVNGDDGSPIYIGP